MVRIKKSDKAKADFAEHWDKEVRNTWPSNYPSSLSHHFKKLGVKSILDCAGGTGYPSIELKELGWNIVYSDGAQEMLEFFKSRTEVLGVEIPAYHSRWEELSTNQPYTYDAILCAGNSFVGITAYDSGFSIDAAVSKIHMIQALSEFYKVLNKGGVLYIDLFKDKFAAPKQPYSLVSHSEATYSFTTISYDPVRNIRTGLTTKIALADGLETDVITKVAPLFATDLIDLLLEAGFSRVECSTVDDADYVDSFFAFKD
jgi:SAM-dependent methyltransferase